MSRNGSSGSLLSHEGGDREAGQAALLVLGALLGGVLVLRLVPHDEPLAVA